MQQPATKVSITQTNSLTSHKNNQKKEGKTGLKKHLKYEYDWLEKMRNAIMAVASLIATMTFQAGVDPPHSRWQDASSFELDATTQRYACFLFCSTTGFLTSLSIILLLISGLPLNRRIFMWILMGTRGLPSQQWY